MSETSVATLEGDMSTAERMRAMHGAGMRPKSVDTITVTPAPVESGRPEVVRVPVVREVSAPEAEETAEAEELLEEAVVEEEPQPEKLTTAHFDDRMKDIIFERGKHANPHDGHVAVVEEYIKNEDDPELQRFGKVMALAEWARDEERLMSNLKLAHGDKDLIDATKRLVCGYNQVVGNLVDKDEKLFPRRKMVSWLTQAGRNEDWAKRVMGGIAGERAAERLLADVDGIEDLRHGDVGEDVQGQDLLFKKTKGGYTSIDVKVRELVKLKPVGINPESGAMTLYISPQHLEPDAYEIKPKYVEKYRTMLEKVLVRGEELVPEDFE